MISSVLSPFKLLVATGALLATGLASTQIARAAAQDYRFELVGKPTVSAGKDTVQLRLIHVADGKPVSDAVIFEGTADMGQAGTFSNHAYAYTGRSATDLARSISFSSSAPDGSGIVRVQQRGDSSPMVVSPGGNVPRTGSEQGAITPNAAAGAGSQARGPERMITAPSGSQTMTPTSSNSQGEPESHNSMPMPRSAGSAMGAQSAPDVMVTAPSGPQTMMPTSSNSQGEPESHSSMPMPRSAPTRR